MGVAVFVDVCFQATDMPGMGLHGGSGPRTCKWLTSMVSKSPKHRVVPPPKWPLHGLEIGGDPDHLLPGMVLQVCCLQELLLALCKHCPIIAEQPWIQAFHRKCGSSTV